MSADDDTADALPEDTFGDAAREAFDAKRNELALTKLESSAKRSSPRPSSRSQRRPLRRHAAATCARDGTRPRRSICLTDLEWRVAHIDGVEGGCAPCGVRVCTASSESARTRGRHVVYVRARATNKVPPDNAMHMAWELELLDGNRAPGRIVWLIDLRARGARPTPPWRSARSRCSLSTIPRVGQLLLVNLPWLFFGLYKAVTPVMDPVTRSRSTCCVPTSRGRPRRRACPGTSASRCARGSKRNCCALRCRAVSEIKLSRRLGDEATFATLYGAADAGQNRPFLPSRLSRRARRASRTPT